MDHFFCYVYLRRQIRFMSRSPFFGNSPVLSYLFRVSGHFPVHRGHHDEEAFVTAHSVLRGCFPRVRVSYGEPLRFERRPAPDREA
jgi:hypothetical protein